MAHLLLFSYIPIPSFAHTPIAERAKHAIIERTAKVAHPVLSISNVDNFKSETSLRQRNPTSAETL